MTDRVGFLRRIGPAGWVGRVLATATSPTGDLYLANSCADWIEQGLIRRVAPTVFVSDTAELVMRHDGRAPPSAVRRRRVWLMDDIWWSHRRAHGLPLGFRVKQSLLDVRAARFHLRRAEHVVLASDALLKPAARAAPRAALHRIDPYWSEPLGGVAHLEGQPYRIAFLGGVSHRADLEFLGPVLRSVLDRHEQVRLVLSGEAAPPAELAGHPRIERLAATGWTGYRKELLDLRCHLALYPLLSTPFNAARSVNKLIEHAVIGAPGLYSAGWEAGDAAAAAGAGLSLPVEPRAWLEAIERLIEDREFLRSLATQAQRHAARINDPAPQRALWARLLLGRGV